MSSRPSWSPSRTIRAIFAERRVYIRTDNSTRYLAIRPATQVVGVIAVAAVLGWAAYATSAMVSRALDGHTAQSKLEVMAEAYKARLAAYANQQLALEEQLNQANQRRDEVTQRLSDKQARLIDAANNLQAAQAELTVLRGEYEDALDAKHDDAARLTKLEARRSELEATITESRTVNANLDSTLARMTQAMDQVVAERDATTDSEARLNGEVVRLATAVDQMQDREDRLLSQLEDAARTSFAGMETLFSRSSIDLDRILAEARRDYSGTGGPFQPITDEDQAASDSIEADTRVASLMQDLDTVNLMRFAAQRLPFGIPFDGGRVTSGFGPRRDPKGRGRGMHEGIDIAAPRGTPVHATASGVVIFAGRQRGYGIVVKIRHAFGFETVYAHNSRARVKVGQRVSRGDWIGDVGSTGRSTGNHLHYEIRIDNKPVNPMKFVEAARDVL